MGEGYENRCGFSPVLHHFGLFFLESEDEIYACLFKTIIEEIEVTELSRQYMYQSERKRGIRYYFRRAKHLSAWKRYYT